MLNLSIYVVTDGLMRVLSHDFGTQASQIIENMIVDQLFTMKLLLDST